MLLRTPILLTLKPRKSFGELLEISSNNFIFLTYNSGFSYIEQTSEPLEKEYHLNLT